MNYDACNKCTCNQKIALCQSGIFPLKKYLNLFSFVFLFSTEIPELTVFEKDTADKKLKKWYMLRTNDNEKEYLQITNKIYKKYPNEKRFCGKWAIILVII